MRVKVEVTKKMYYDKNSSWGAYVVTPKEEFKSQAIQYEKGVPTMVLAGNMQELNSGVTYLVDCEEDFNKKYKQWQLKAKVVYEETPKTADQQKIFLESILTKTQAKNLLAKHPNIVSDIIEDRDIDLTEVYGIAEARFEKIKEKVKDNYLLSEVLEFLTPYGLTYKQIKRVAENTHDIKKLKELILQNPYILIHSGGFTFNKLDDIALKINPELRISRERVEAFFDYFFNKEETSSGNTCLKKTVLDDAVKKDIPECYDLVQGIYLEEKEDNTFLHIEDDYFGSLKSYATELEIYSQLERINSAKPKIAFPSKEQLMINMKKIEEKQGFEFSLEQAGTLNRMTESGNVLIVSGSAGSGKTSTVNGIIELMEAVNGNRRLQISQMALSAKASIRMKELTDRNAVTIAKFLFNIQQQKYKKLDEDESQEVFQETIAVKSSDIIIIDEYSMVNIYTTLDILREVEDGTILIFVFDYAQLPAIGAGTMAYDLLELSHYKKSKYKEVHRQGKDSGILMDANTIKNQINPVDKYKSTVVTGENKDMAYMFRRNKEDINTSVISTFMNGVEKFGIDNINIITPRKERLINSAQELNIKIQNLVLPKDSVDEYKPKFKEFGFRVGDRVIHKKNMSNMDVYNGEIGTVTSVINNKDSDVKVKVRFNYGKTDKIVRYDDTMLKYLELGYALTVHSYQGSENKAMVVTLDSDSKYCGLLDNTMLYTAITRAKEKCVLITDPNSFEQCIKTHNTLERDTWSKRIIPRKGDLNE